MSNKYYKNQYLAFLTEGTKVVSKMGVAGDSREDARKVAESRASKHGWSVKVFPSHFGRYGKEYLDHLNPQTA